MPMSKELYIATNNGDMGGGEMMLMALARQARSLGYAVTIVGPAQPAQLIEAAADEGFRRIALPATNRVQYMASLRAWHAKHKDKLLWCNGLVPAVATGGRKNRIVHLHQLPAGLNAKLLPFARRKALATLVPSKFMAAKIPNTEVLHNWVSGIAHTPDNAYGDSTICRIGFIGRLTPIKGITVLAEAIALLNCDTKKYHLVIAGEPVFTSEDDKRTVTEALNKVASTTTELGWVSPEELYSQIDILVVPSQWEEPFGLVAAEAMSARIPLVVTRSGGLPEVVGESYPFMVDRGEPQALAETIEKISKNLRDFPEDIERITNHLFWRWQEHFSPEAARANVRAILERFL